MTIERLRNLDRNRLVWGIFGLLLTGVLAVVIRPFIGTFMFSIFLYYAIRPIYRRVNDHLSHPNVSAIVTLLVVALPGLLITGYAMFIGAQNLTHLLQSADLQQYQSIIQPYLNVSNAFQQPQTILSKLRHSPLPTTQSSLLVVFTTLGTYLGMIFSILLRFFLLFAFTFYFLRDDHKLSRWFRELFVVDDGHFDAGSGVIQDYVENIDDDLQTIYRGNMMNVIAISVLALLTYYSLNILLLLQ